MESVMPKLPIAVAVATQFEAGRSTSELAGLLLGDSDSKEGFLKSLDTKKPDLMSTIGFGMNEFTAADGSVHKLMDPNLQKMNTISQAYVKNTGYILIFDEDALQKIQRLNFKVFAVKYDATTNDVALRPATTELLALPQQTVADDKTKKLFDNMLPRIGEVLETLNRNKKVEEHKANSPKHNVSSFFNAVPTTPHEQDNNILADWNRTDPRYTPVKIDGVLIQDLVKQERHLTEVPDPLFPDMKSLEDFLRDNLLKNVKQHSKEDALKVVMNNLHQGRWQRPMTAAAFEVISAETNYEIGPMDAKRNTPANAEKGTEEYICQLRNSNFNTTATGFEIDDEVVQTRCAYTQGDNAGEEIEPDAGKDFVYKGKVKLDLDFSQKLDDNQAWPRVVMAEQSMEFGSKVVEKYFDKPGKKNFLSAVMDYIVGMFNAVTGRAPSPHP
jgi:hypothetical protein